MDKKKIITIVSIVVTVFIIAVATVLIIQKNNSTSKTVVAGQNMEDNETQEPVEELVGEETPVESIEPTLSPSPSSSPTPKSTKKPSVPVGKYYIKVNNQMNTVTIYTKDKNGQYTVPVKAMVCSTGNATPKNSKYQLKGRWTWGLMFGGVYTQYETLITGNILFHSVPYLKQYDNGSLEYWAYDKLGTTCSAGCVRLTVADAQWIYYNCPAGTWVEFYSSSNPGPLGKPSAMKISSYTEYRGWDPTDPAANNPWRNAKLNTPSPSPVPSPIVTPTPVITPSPTPKVTPTPQVVPSVKPTASSKPTQSTKVPVPTITTGTSAKPKVTPSSNTTKKPTTPSSTKTVPSTTKK